MFAAFFYLLRQRGLHVSLNEWMTLLEGMEKGLHHSTLTGFYHLCRAIVVKNETEFDHFDQIFLEFFKDVPYTGELPEDLLDWLNHPSEDLKRTIADLRAAGFPDETLEELLKMLEERLKEQTEEHNGGNYWVGTQGRTPWGNSGWHPNGIRIGGQSMHRTAMMVAGERKFRDFRKDNKLDTRQFQMAFRILQRFSNQNGAEDEFDIDETINQTSKKGGILQIRYKKPRRNTIKVLLLMDCGGSMDPYSQLCSRLFQAASRSNRFKDLKVYYFHNCIEEYLYTSPTIEKEYAVSTLKVLRECDKDYRVIMVGDADQLPSVGPGNLLGEIIRSGCVPTVCLNEIFRQAKRSLIVENAHHIICGEPLQKGGKTDDFFFLEADGDAAQKLVCDLVTTRLPRSYGFDPVRDIQVLCPTKLGPTGTQALNVELQNLLNPEQKGKPQLQSAARVFRVGDKVMQVRNNYEIVWQRIGGEQGVGAYNGDIGIVESINTRERSMVVRMDDRRLVYPAENLNELEIAYAITVHKSQGSEFPAVILPVAQVPPRLCYRNLFYTGVTRARKLCIVAGRRDVANRMMSNVRQNLRYSGLCALLQAELPPEQVRVDAAFAE